MQHEQYYCIEGNDKLLSNNDLDETLRKSLAEPIVLINPEGGRTCWMKNDYEMSVKIMFLISLNQDCEHSFIKESPISVDFFDQWWNLKSCSYEIHREEILESVDSSIISRIKLTGKPLPDSFIKDIKEKNGG